MVRRKIEIKPLEDRAKRHTTFTKRRDGLIKKIVEFCLLSNSDAMMIAFSRSGNCYALGHPHVDVVLGRYEEENPQEAEASAAGERLHETEEAPEAETSAVGESLKKRIRGGINSGRWDEAERGLELQELNEMTAKMESMKRRVLAAAMPAAMPAADETGSSVGYSC